MKNRSTMYIIEFFVFVLCVLGVIGACVIRVDPFLHYHKPLTDAYFYSLDNQRSQNNGILKQFEYNALITGTSMTENFKTSEFDEIFGVNSIKIPYFGASYKEINDSLVRALDHNPDLDTIVRGLDMNQFMEDKDSMRFEQDEYPSYLYDKNYLNDVRYVFNRNVIFDRVWPMMNSKDHEGFSPGITSFDAYSNWMDACTFGLNIVIENTFGSSGFEFQGEGAPNHITESQQTKVMENVHQNITSLANMHPDVTFYYFFTPYSIVWWQQLVEDGSIYRQVEAERLVIEEILKCPNIKLYSFNNIPRITTDLNNYRDTAHYGEWINSLMLKWMHDGKYLLTQENYENYLTQELTFYTSYDYNSILSQEDYENDYWVAVLWRRETADVEPFLFSGEMLEQGELCSADIVYDQYDGTAGIECHGFIGRSSEENTPLADYMMNYEYVGCKVHIEDLTDYAYLVFYGRKNAANGQPSVFLYGQEMDPIGYTAGYKDLDDEWHQYAIDVSQLNGEADVIFNGGYTDSTGSADSSYTFSNIVLY